MALSLPLPSIGNNNAYSIVRVREACRRASTPVEGAQRSSACWPRWGLRRPRRFSGCRWANQQVRPRSKRPTSGASIPRGALGFTRRSLLSALISTIRRLLVTRLRLVAPSSGWGQMIETVARIFWPCLTGVARGGSADFCCRTVGPSNDRDHPRADIGREADGWPHVTPKRAVSSTSRSAAVDRSGDRRYCAHI